MPFGPNYEHLNFFQGKNDEKNEHLKTLFEKNPTKTCTSIGTVGKSRPEKGAHLEVFTNFRKKAHI